MPRKQIEQSRVLTVRMTDCLLYTSDAADERSSVDLGGRRIIKKKNKYGKENRREGKENNDTVDNSTDETNDKGN